MLHARLSANELDDACRVRRYNHRPHRRGAMGHLLFDSVDEFQRAWGPNAEAIVGDVPNYTNTQPTIQLSEVKL